ncbi:MAG: hypothetical protein JXX14_26345 [Deltaproteobacteria bacterium]|nr:hypothetical protein [Deltaproteobacteria bacterium]
MTISNRILTWMPFLPAILLLWGCSASDSSARAMGSSADGDGEYGNYSDSDSDSDGDADSDADWNGDASSDEDDGETVLPEVETKFDYRIPVSSGRFVFIADRLNSKVIAVDSETLEIFTTEVGSTPTHVVPLSDNGDVAVISLNADEVTLIRMQADGSADTVELDIRPDTNALAVSHSGRYVIAFFDALFEADSGAPSTDQEITVIDTTAGAEKAFDISVGIHPMEVVFSADDSKAFVISESGVDIIELAALSPTYFPDSISLFDFTEVSPEKTETLIDPTGTYAIGRREDKAVAYVVKLDGSEPVREYELNGIPTDVDIAKDGTFGVYTVRSAGEAAIFSLPFPADAATSPFTVVDLGERSCGAATISDDGQYVAMFTSVADEEDDEDTSRRVLTVLHRNGAGFDVDGTLLNRDIKGILPAPDSGALLVVHELWRGGGAGLNLPYAYSLVKLPGLQSKFQQLSVDPMQMLVTDDGAFAYMLLSTQQIQIINMDTFIVDVLSLGSTPQAAGYAANTDKVFISQQHPSGRMTFMDVDGTNVKTITGYTLNDQSTR